MHRLHRTAPLLLLAVVPVCASGQSTTPSQVIPIAEARARPEGEVVVVEGLVTVASGSIDRGFAVQDRTGGIYVLAPDSGAWALGTRLRVAGMLTNPNQQFALQPLAVRVLDLAQPPEPRSLATAAVNEATEGLLVRVGGRVHGPVVDDAPWGWKITIDDGSGPLLVFVSRESGIDVRGIAAGQVLQVTGFSGQFDDHYEVLPRGQADLRIR